MTTKNRRALIVIDVQNEYESGNLMIEYPDIRQSLANIGTAMDAARTSDIPIIVVQQYAPADSPIFAAGTHAWALHEVVQSRQWQHYIEKKLPSAFAGTDLASWLAENKIDTLAVTGYMTHNCVDSTIKHAFHSGLAVEYLSDASGSLSYINKAGSATGEEIHRTFCVVMQARFAAVMSTNEWLQVISDKAVAERDGIYKSNLRARNAAVKVAA